jgi:hypothetical protein
MQAHSLTPTPTPPPQPLISPLYMLRLPCNPQMLF